MKIVGNITVTGVTGAVAWSGYITAQNKLADWDFSDGADSGETRDGLNDYLNVTSSGDTERLNLTIIPRDPASPGNLATAKSNVQLPPKLAKVTISGTGITRVDGDWHYSRSGGGNIKPDASGGSLKVSMTLERFTPSGGGAPAYLGDPVTVS